MRASLPSAAQLLRSERSFNTIVIGAVILGFVTLLAVGAAGIFVMRQNLSFTAWVTHTYDVESGISDFRILDERIETARRGYLLSHDERFARAVDTLKGQLQAAIVHMQQTTLDNPTQQANLARLKVLVGQQLQAIDISMAFARSGANDSSSFFDDTGVTAARDLRQLARKMLAQEQDKLVERDRARLDSIYRLEVIGIMAAMLLTVVAIGSLWVILRYTRDLTSSRADLAELNAGLEDEVQSRTADLQRANDEIQRFAYIVSHDLRSPLVNVMGFTAELEVAARPLAVLLERAEAETPAIVTDEARTAIRTDLPESIGFIRTSTQKMDRLINAILRLSREGRRVLTPEPLDMLRLLTGVADNLKHRSNELGAVIEIDPKIPGLTSDRLALEQVFANLTENALKYLKPGRPGEILLRGSVQGLRVVYEVIDNGRGIDPKDHERIFDLFRRSGVQDQPGEGIGLAHVRALVYRLGGVISVDSALDRGATFRVSLPARLTIEGQFA